MERIMRPVKSGETRKRDGHRAVLPTWKRDGHKAVLSACVPRNLTSASHWPTKPQLIMQHTRQTIKGLSMFGAGINDWPGSRVSSYRKQSMPRAASVTTKQQIANKSRMQLMQALWVSLTKWRKKGSMQETTRINRNGFVSMSPDGKWQKNISPALRAAEKCTRRWMLILILSLASLRQQWRGYCDAN